MSWESETALRCAAIICGQRRAAIKRLKEALAGPHGDHEFGLLIERFFLLDAETRTAVIQRMNPKQLRIVREESKQAQERPKKNAAGQK